MSGEKVVMFDQVGESLEKTRRKPGKNGVKIR